MDLTTRVHNNTGRHLTMDLLDQFGLRRVPGRPIKAGGSLDLGRRFGFSDNNPQLRLHLRVVDDSRLLVAPTIMPFDVFVNAEIYLSSSIDSDTGSEMIRVTYRPAARSIDRVRVIRWARDLKAKFGAIYCGGKATSIV